MVLLCPLSLLFLLSVFAVFRVGLGFGFLGLRPLPQSLKNRADGLFLPFLPVHFFFIFSSPFAVVLAQIFHFMQQRTAHNFSPQPSLQPRVRQLEKPQRPTPKAAPKKDLGTGRHQNENLHALTHAGETFEPQSLKTRQGKPFSLYKTAENGFLKTIPLLFDALESAAVVFHNPAYVEEVFATYHSIHAHLFLEWVKTFAIIRKADRTTLSDDVIQSTDEDFLTALRLFKLQQTKPKRKRQNQTEKIWQAIEKHFPEQPFTSTDLAEVTLLPRPSINGVLRQLKEDGKLKRCRKTGGTSKRYQLIQN